MYAPKDRGAARQLGSLDDLVGKGLPVFLGDVVFDELGIVGEAGGEGGGPRGDSKTALEGWWPRCVGEGDSAARGDGRRAQAAVVVFDVRGE